MSEIEYRKQSHSWEILPYQPCKKIIPQLLLSISIFSFMYSYSFLYKSPSLPHPPKFHHLPIKYFHLLTHSLNKNYLFLVCNGLLVFLAKTSGLMVPPEGSDEDDTFRMRMNRGPKTGLEAKLEPILEKFLSEKTHANDQPKEDEEKVNEVSISIHESEDGGGYDMEDGWRNDDDDHQVGSTSFWLFDNDDDVKQLDEEEFEEEDQIEVDISADELNKKFEDFIRRMKKGR